MRVRWLTVGVVVAAGCNTLLTPTPKPHAGIEPAPVAVRENERGDPLAGDRTVPQPAPPVEPPPPADDPLTLAADCLERGDRPAAAGHLGSYVRAHPDEIMFRAHLAELLLKLDRPAEAKAQFERFVAAAQETTGPPRAHLVHCHTRLMEIGQRADDRSAEVFHRGVGLLLLVTNPPADDDQTAAAREQILCRAITALIEASELRPTDPRVRLYLADAHARAGNRRGADAARAAARRLTGPGTLTPAEQGRLALAPGP